MHDKDTKLTKEERGYLKQLVTECLVQRFTRAESLAFIHSRLKRNISIDYMDKIITQQNKSVSSRIKNLQKHRTAFISEFFRRIDEIEKYQKDLWATIHTNPTDGFLRKHCISELHSLTITLTNLYQILPTYTAGYLKDDLISKDTLSQEKPNISIPVRTEDVY